MKQPAVTLIAAACLLSLQSCGGGGSSSANAPQTAAQCSVAAQRASLSIYMADQYYWNTQLAPADPNAATMDAYFQSMLDKPTDRYSYTQTTASFDQTYTEGTRTGYGYSLGWDETATDELRVRYVEAQSPVGQAGMKRGDIVVSIDGQTPTQIANGALATVTTEGVPRTFVLRDAATGATRQFTVQSATFAIAPVAFATTLPATRNGQPVQVGYLAYHQFVPYSTTQLATTIDAMAAQGVGEFVLDLRYNGGGTVSTSRDLASMISGTRTDGATFVTMRFNAQQSAQNSSLPFLNAQTRYFTPLQPVPRVFVLVSGNTASASELLINGLKPFMQVVLVGETTYGKPYGFVPRDSCGITYNAVNFESVNALGVGGYDNGIAPDCRVTDDLDHPLGDPGERRMQAALQYIATGACPAQPQSARMVSRHSTRTIGEGAEIGMFR